MPNRNPCNPHIATVSYIPPTRVAAQVESLMVHAWSAMVPTGSARLFGYQHVDIGNAKRKPLGKTRVK